MGYATVKSVANVTFKLPSAKQFVQAMQELSPPIKMMLSNVASVKRTEVLKAITDELGRSYKDKKTGHIRLKDETICISGRKSMMNKDD
jgi:hypothetical protein